MNGQYAASVPSIRLSLNLHRTLGSFKAERLNFASMTYQGKYDKI